MPKVVGLTPKQRAFVEAYQGNASQAAIEAGYSAKTAEWQGPQLLQKPHVREAIKKRQDIESRERIANRQERQAFWTKIMFDPNENMKDRLRASELLGKSECDFTERHEVTGADGAALGGPVINVGFVSPMQEFLESNHEARQVLFELHQKWLASQGS